MVQLRHTLLLPLAFFTSLSSSLGPNLVSATPAPASALQARDLKDLTQDQINLQNPYAYFSAAAYCMPAQVQSWNCGTNCDNADPNFETYVTGGDGSGIPYYYVGYSPKLQSAVIGHRGMSESDTEALLTMNSPALVNLDPTLFPEVNSGVMALNHIVAIHANTACTILNYVRKVLSDKGTNSITFVGHGAGAAVSLLDALYIPQNIYDGINYMSVLYALPRVGNQAFANYIDENIKHVTHINNKQDYIPVLPSTGDGYVNVNGEIHIMSNGDWTVCPGDDNPSSECSTGSVPNSGSANTANYVGPYNGINMSC